MGSSDDGGWDEALTVAEPVDFILYWSFVLERVGEGEHVSKLTSPCQVRQLLCKVQPLQSPYHELKWPLWIKPKGKAAKAGNILLELPSSV